MARSRNRNVRSLPRIVMKKVKNGRERMKTRGLGKNPNGLVISAWAIHHTSASNQVNKLSNDDIKLHAAPSCEEELLLQAGNHEIIDGTSISAMENTTAEENREMAKRAQKDGGEDG